MKRAILAMTFAFAFTAPGQAEKYICFLTGSIMSSCEGHVYECVYHPRHGMTGHYEIDTSARKLTICDLENGKSICASPLDVIMSDGRIEVGVTWIKETGHSGVVLGSTAHSLMIDKRALQFTNAFSVSGRKVTALYGTCAKL